MEAWWMTDLGDTKVLDYLGTLGLGKTGRYKVTK